MWVKPDQLAKLGVTAIEIINALQVQNNVNPAGQIGGEPVPAGQQFTYTVRTQGRLVTPEEFGKIIVRANPDGSVLYLRDVARIELGQQDYSPLGAIQRAPPPDMMAVYQLPGSNAVAKQACWSTSGSKNLAVTFPAGMRYDVPLDTTKAVTAGIHEIVLTLGIALALVILVVYIFLQGWRATLIPLMAVPVSLDQHVHSISVTGIFHQYAFVVRPGAGHRTGGGRRHHRGGSRGAPDRPGTMEPRDAAIQSHGASGRPGGGDRAHFGGCLHSHRRRSPAPSPVALYQQFAITIAVSVLISAFNALTLSLGVGGAPAQAKPKILIRRRGPLWRISSISSICGFGYTAGKVCLHLGCADSQVGRDHAGSAGDRGNGGLHGRTDSGRLHSARGSRIPVRCPSVARCILAAAYRCSGAAREQRSPEDPWNRGRGGGGRVQPAHADSEYQHGILLRVA